MKKIFAYILIGLLPATHALAADTEQLTQKSRAAIKALGSELKATLQSSMKASGPVDSVAVCQIEAPKIADTVSSANGPKILYAMPSSKGLIAHGPSWTWSGLGWPPPNLT